MSAELEESSIGGDMIRLGAFLKFAGLIDSGAQAKDLLAEDEVVVNGEIETRRGRQLHVGDVVECRGRRLQIGS